LGCIGIVISYLIRGMNF